MNVSCAVMLIVLHMLDGQEVTINPAQVTHLIARYDGTHFTGGVNCMVNLTGGKFVNVTDTCDSVRKLLTEAKCEPPLP